LMGLGTIATTGKKEFIEPHPTDPAQALYYLCTESNESMVEVRGKGQTSGGTAVIPLSPSFSMVGIPNSAFLAVSDGWPERWPLGPVELVANNIQHSRLQVSTKLRIGTRRCHPFGHRPNGNRLTRDLRRPDADDRSSDIASRPICRPRLSRGP